MMFTIASLSLLVAGCGSETATNDSKPPSEMPPDTVEHAHAHPSEGPHHGTLIELGGEEYHGELVHDDAAKSVTIYILDGTAKRTVPIEATEVVINVKHGDAPEQFRLAASPTGDDPAGKSSRFVSNDAELGEHLDEEGAEATLVVTIEGKSFRGRIEHGHDHGHEHGH
ncbi:MAG: hypothetical protein WD066_03535 [Planctomycetaceae bacterium]